MMINWPTRNEDLKDAQAIIERFQFLNGDEPLRYIEIEEDNHKMMMPEWVGAVMEYFVEKYGHENGYRVTQLVITKNILADEILH